MTRKRRSFTAAQKAEAVRKHLKDHIPVSQIADEMKVQPTIIRGWVNTVLSQVEHVFETPRSAKHAHPPVSRGFTSKVLKAGTTEVTPDKCWLGGGEYVASATDGWL